MLGMQLWVDRATLEPGDTPIVGVPLTPRVTLRTDDPNTPRRGGNGANGYTNPSAVKKISADEFREAGSEGLGDLKAGEVAIRSRWYRCLGGRKGAFCSCNPDLEATIQCLICVKLGVPVSRSYFSSPQCYAQHWNEHKKLHCLCWLHAFRKHAFRRLMYTSM